MSPQESSSTAYHFDEDLRDVPTYPSDLLKHVEKLQQEYKFLKNPTDQIRVLGELGVYLRQLMKLDESERILEQALQLVNQYQLGIKLEAQQKIRLAHVFQWKKDFIKSTQMFSNIIEFCRNNTELNVYYTFALQHAGKNLFDQGQFKEALLHFNEALSLRIKNNYPQDQIDSTKLAIKGTRDKVKTKLIVRKAIPGDEEGLAKTHIQSWQETYKNIVPQGYLDSLPNELHERIQNWSKTILNPKRWLWVATIDDQIVGFALFGLPRDSNKDGYIELGAIYLLEKFKGLGIGFSLLSEGFSFMYTLGYKKSYCWVLDGNPTVKFYERSGAKFSGDIKNDEIGGQKFNELAYEWESTDLLGLGTVK